MTRTLFLDLFCREALDAPEVLELRRLAAQVYLRPRKTIFLEGDPADDVFGVSQGVVRLYKLLPDGRRQILSFALPGDFLGLPLAERRSFSADAVGEVVLCRFSRNDLTRHIRSSPDVMRLLIEFATRELDFGCACWIGI